MTTKPEVGKKQRAPFITKTRSVDEAARTIEFVASDESVDRYGDIIRAAYWKVDNLQSFFERIEKKIAELGEAQSVHLDRRIAPLARESVVVPELRLVVDTLRSAMTELTELREEIGRVVHQKVDVESISSPKAQDPFDEFIEEYGRGLLMADPGQGPKEGFHG